MWSIPQRHRGAGAAALFVRVAAAITDDIRAGSLRAGDRLPSTRALADRLGVNRNTVVAAYDELIAQGWLAPRGPAGTFVAGEPPERTPRRAARPAAPGMAARPGFDLPAIAPVDRSPAGPPEARFHVSVGVPDTRLLPHAALARAYRRALRSPAARAGLDYADPRGAPSLRAALAAMLRATRALPVGPENIMVIRGSQMGLDLAARLLVRPGDVVAVEELGYRPAWRAFAAAGARLAPVGLDESGAIADELGTPRALYVTPHHQYPTTVLMSPSRRMALLARARAGRVAVIEDDYDHEFHFDGRPVAPLAADDRGAQVIYLGTLSKILAPGLRLGFVAAPEPVIEAMAGLRSTIDRQGDQVLEHAVADLIDDGELQRHARKMRRVYQARRDTLVGALERELGGALSFQIPPGGMTLWVRVDDAIRLEPWRRACLARGVAFATARDFDLAGRARPYLRLAHARYSESELVEAVKLMAKALADQRRG